MHAFKKYVLSSEKQSFLKKERKDTYSHYIGIA